MKKLKNLFLLLFIPEVVFASSTQYIICGNDRRFPLVFANLFSTIIIFVKIFIPIMLVISGMITFFKVAASSKVEDELKKAKDKMINRFIAAVIVFLILSIVSTLLSIFVKSSYSVMGCVRCLFDPSKCETVEVDNGVNVGVGNSSNGNLSGYVTKPVANAPRTDVYTAVSRPITGSTYTSNAPAYASSADFYRNVNYKYFATAAQAGKSSSGSTFYGQCPWYARGRAIEIIANSNMPDDMKQERMNVIRNNRGDGGTWYNNLPGSVFKKSTDIYAAKPGSIVSWSEGFKAGHVGIVEDVEYKDGKLSRIRLSESWNHSASPSGADYQLKWWTVEKFRHYYGKHNFIGYVYLLD